MVYKCLENAYKFDVRNASPPAGTIKNDSKHSQMSPRGQKGFLAIMTSGSFAS